MLWEAFPHPGGQAHTHHLGSSCFVLSTLAKVLFSLELVPFSTISLLFSLIYQINSFSFTICLLLKVVLIFYVGKATSTKNIWLSFLAKRIPHSSPSLGSLRTWLSGSSLWPSTASGTRHSWPSQFPFSPLYTPHRGPCSFPDETLISYWQQW